jgi:hypothetical protein
MKHAIVTSGSQTIQQLMKPNKTLLLAVGALVVAGVAIILRDKSGFEASPASSSESGKRGSLSGEGTGKPPGAAGSSGRAGPASRAREERQPSAYADLVARYGEARTNLSKNVSANIVAVMEDATEMSEMIASSEGEGFGGGIGAALGGLNGELQLSEEQRDKALALFKEHQKRKSANYSAAVDRLRKDPSPLMQLVLAGDAGARGEITEDEYRKSQADAGESLAGIINPLDRKNFGGGSPMRDPEFVKGLEAVLDETQNETLAAAVAKRESEYALDPATVPGVEEGGIAGLQKMEIEKLDEAMESARKVTTGIKSMMEGMGGLRGVIPGAQGGGR